MAEDTSFGPTDGLSRNPDGRGQAATLVEVEPPMERSSGDGPEETIVAEMFELEEETALDEAAEAPAESPWWKRILAFARRPQGEVIADVISAEEATPPNGAPHPEVVLPEMLCEGEERERLPPKPIEEEEAPPEADAPTPYSLLPASTFTLDDVRALVQEELAQTQGDVPRLVQAELARERQDHRRAALLALQEVADDISEVKPEFLVTELDVLNEEEQRTLQKPDMPVRERMNLLDFIRERRAQVAQQIAAAEAAMAQRIAETDLVLAELEGRDIVARLREDLEGQRQEIAAVEARLAARPTAGLGLPFGSLTAQWATLLVVVLLAVAVGVAGVLLPRQQGPAPISPVDIARLYQEVGRKEAAIELLDKAVRAGIDDAETLGQAGQTYYALGEYQKAAEILSQAVERAPQDEETRLALARSYGKVGQYQEAVAQYEQLIESSPGNWRYYLEAGQQYEALQDYERALGQYQKVAEVAAERVEGYTSQGDLYRNTERYDEAIEQYRRALEINPNAVGIRIALGKSYAVLQNWERAIEQFRAAMELAPNSPAPYLEMGKVWRTQGKYEGALSWYQDALDVQPDHVPTLLEMSDTYLELGDCEQATLRFLRVLEIQPNNKVAQDGLKVCQG